MSWLNPTLSGSNFIKYIRYVDKNVNHEKLSYMSSIKQILQIIIGVEPVYPPSLSHISQELAQILNTDNIKEKHLSASSTELHVLYQFDFQVGPSSVELQRNEDFTFVRITKNYNKYFRGPEENETKYEEFLCR